LKKEAVTVHINQLAKELVLKKIKYCILYFYVCTNKFTIMIQEITSISFKSLRKKAVTVHIKQLAKELELR